MPQDAKTASQGKSQPRPRKEPKAVSWPFFTTPQPIKRLFDKFPLYTYPHNELPERTAQHRDQNALYIFTTDDGTRRGLPSYNPGCLKWQVEISPSLVLRQAANDFWVRRILDLEIYPLLQYHQITMPRQTELCHSFYRLPQALRHLTSLPLYHQVGYSGGRKIQLRSGKAIGNIPT